MANNSTVALGNFELDPLEPTDFHLTVEGASNTGKSNTFTAIHENLVETPDAHHRAIGHPLAVRKLDEREREVEEVGSSFSIATSSVSSTS